MGGMKEKITHSASNKQPQKKPTKNPISDKKIRLAAALRENLLRRKAATVSANTVEEK